MERFKSADELLDFAIEREQEAARFYSELAEKMANPSMTKVFQGFSQEELRHKKKLQVMKERKLLRAVETKIADLRIGDYLVEVEPSPDLSYQEALILAMKREKASFKLYNDLAAMAEDQALRETLLALAQEEAKHKLRFEIEYDEFVMSEN